MMHSHREGGTIEDSPQTAAERRGSKPARSSDAAGAVATSRELLGAAGELTWQVPPLSGPDPSRQPAIEELEGYESVRLFVERARYRNAAFMLTPRNAGAMAGICARLDGIPLAIGLAAARAGMSAERGQGGARREALGSHRSPGEPGRDTIYGGYGNDRLQGDERTDTLKGGPGNDHTNAETDG